MKKIIRTSQYFAATCFAAFFLFGCKQEALQPETTVAVVNPAIPKSPGMIVIPANNPMTQAKIDLGRFLFYDQQLSVDGSTSCSSCHDPSIGFADLRGLQTSMGFRNRMGTRNAPALANIAYNTVITWEGRFKTLEEHAQAPIFNQLEMGNNFSNKPQDTVPSGYNSGSGPEDTLFLFKRLNQQRPGGAYMSDLFISAYGSSDIKMWKIANAIACFERTFISTGSAFDKYNNGDASAYKYNPAALHGFQLFTGKANCVSCHNGYDFTDQQFHNNGIGKGAVADSGRMNVTKQSADLYKFKTPSLRNIALTGPYMHDGRYNTLEDVIRMNYLPGGADQTSTSNKDEKIKPLDLTDQEVADIIAFLETLTDDHFTVNSTFANPWVK